MNFYWGLYIFFNKTYNNNIDKFNIIYIKNNLFFRVSYLEIYNERVNDLLNKSGTDLKLKEDGNGQVILLCKEEITNSPENVLSIMKKGNKNRRTGETNMNERSSRSHTIFRIVSLY